MNYIEITFEISPVNPGVEILSAKLSEIDFESFVETDEGLLAYIPEEKYEEKKLKDLQLLNSDEFRISYNSKIIKNQNWNKLWESNFKPIIIAERCGVRASFHPEFNNIEHEIIINPQMSFGTAHHETTAMMIELMLDMKLKGKSVLDFGCGTSVLSILAAKLGAENIMAVDNDEWAYENSLENIKLNNLERIKVLFGDAQIIKNKKFNIIIANINRNILIKSISDLNSALSENGMLMMSGFYEDDIKKIREETEKFNLKFVDFIVKNKWAAIRLKK